MDPLPKVIEAFSRGNLVIVADDHDGENEADLFISASLCTPERMAFMIRHTSGIVCAPISEKEAHRLGLNPMVMVNNAPLNTAFTISVDLGHGLTTGISALERTRTVQGLANPDLGAADFVCPGHIFPLIAREGGVLTRSGHTEACVDLCGLADLPPVGVLAELMNDDGTVMRGESAKRFAREHNLPMTSVADIIAYRLEHETCVTRTTTFPLDTPFGPLTSPTYSQVIPYMTSFDSHPYKDARG